jgi:hypothetical protein
VKFKLDETAFVREWLGKVIEMDLDDRLTVAGTSRIRFRSRTAERDCLTTPGVRETRPAVEFRRPKSEVVGENAFGNNYISVTATYRE